MRGYCILRAEGNGGMEMSRPLDPTTRIAAGWKQGHKRWERGARIPWALDGAEDRLAISEGMKGLAKGSHGWTIMACEL